ncbi:hypothetical protein [Pseudoxanthomonas sacheonensis]|uniref:hypothetical protein n=1 Tax=Pseudoxanthomonas sacheonensis TaxID=443615 RepID=UPI0013D832A0|nr:hypothetical protein [Pseudoxanthomonas sacheonensis]KAF1706245.1 hypothetical protein CSC73_16190 [Pseudoxanthomonas sacheonensis]
MTSKESKAVAIQRYTPALNDDESMDGTKVASMDPYTEGRFVLFADHQSALHAAESLLAEAEMERDQALREADNLHRGCADLVEQNLALQSRLDAVDALADEMEGIGRANWTHPKRKEFAKQLRRAALGCATTGEGGT